MSEHDERLALSSQPQVPLALVKTKEAYRSWHSYLRNIHRIDRYTIGAKIDEVFISLLEFIYHACFASDKFEKLSCLTGAITKSDLLKFLLQLAWEQKIIDHKRYGALLLDLDEIGRMLGGWKRAIHAKAPNRYSK